ncbi:hypothetical protein EFO90_11525 [Lactiplantibacillus plantarum]|uniref:hypothetical protein n=1 Tax=Lactiplantibacillus plantarum TaxID=1590 RepID=UPI0021823FDD|nr:hypothetical protein [Lactiplantibacillus plantarum]MCS8620218.1 hypothetical protein [Lactiplantibacillus plantarum]MCT3214966.1 hypothetical protein [Lactiplantibacillus plantarum]MCT3272016.1 hypothetical protein [Lactiplantibacillus plantarum]
MAKHVKFDGNKIGTGTEYSLIDSGKNIKKTVEYYMRMEKSANETDDNYLSIVEHTPKLVEIVDDFVCDLLELNTQQAKRVKAMEFSFSDEYDFFKDCIDKFLGLEIPSLDSEDIDEPEETESPKLPAAD